jgi:hypothetical protein
MTSLYSCCMKAMPASALGILTTVLVGQLALLYRHVAAEDQPMVLLREGHI